MRKLIMLATTALVAGALTVPAFAEFQDRNIRVSNGINEDHPVGNGIKAMNECLAEKSGGKMNRNHQYPDGAVLFLGTMFAPVKDRRGVGQGFTHEVGDRVEISTPKLGRLVNWVDRTDKCPEWTFGIRALIRNLQARNLLDKI